MYHCPLQCAGGGGTLGSSHSKQNMSCHLTSLKKYALQQKSLQSSNIEEITGCIKGHEGFRCKDCSNGYYRSHNFACTECPENPTGFFIAKIVLLVLAAGFLALLYSRGPSMAGTCKCSCTLSCFAQIEMSYIVPAQFNTFACIRFNNLCFTMSHFCFFLCFFSYVRSLRLFPDHRNDERYGYYSMAWCYRSNHGVR